MSAGPGQREVAHRIFAAEFDDATYTYTESDEDRAPNYVVTPTGARINRLFVVGVLTETEWVNEDTIRARVVDPTGPFVLYASQYQPDPRGALDSADPPAFVAVTGKANTFRPDGADRVYSSVRPEAVAVVDAATRDRWAVSTAEHTILRLGRLARALTHGETTDRGIEIATREYDPTPGYATSLYDHCIDVLRLVAEEIETLPDRDLTLDMQGTSDTTVEAIVAAAERLGLAESSPSAPTAEEPSIDDEPAEPVTTAEDPPEEVLSSEERAEVEASFGTDFTTGDEFEANRTAEEAADRDNTDEEGDASDAETTAQGPSIDEQAQTPPSSSTPTDATESTPGHPSTTEDPTDEEAEESTESDSSEPADETETLTVDALIDLMRELDDGSGVDRDDLLESGSEAFDTDTDSVGTTLQTALLEGRCYEAGDGIIRPI